MIPDLLNIILEYVGEYQLLWINPEKIIGMDYQQIIMNGQ